MTRHVVKLGGSLLDRPDLGAALAKWLSDQTPDRQIVLLVGGGKYVDSLREYQRRFTISDEAAHWLAIELLDATSNLVGQLLPEMPAVATIEEIGQSDSPTVRIVPSNWLRKDESQQPGTPLGVGWRVTSDSIAARLAEILGAERLTLLKSRDWSPTAGAGDWQTAAELGYVDADFWRHVAKELVVDCRNFGI